MALQTVSDVRAYLLDELIRTTEVLHEFPVPAADDSITMVWSDPSSYNIALMAAAEKMLVERILHQLDGCRWTQSAS